MMNREDKDAIIRRLEAMYGEAEDNETKEALFYAIETLKEQRPHGEWIFKNGKYRCTACGEKAIYVCPALSTIPKAILTDFCPKCGVQMNAKALEMIRKREGEAE